MKMFDDMYEERHFMRGRDLEGYVKRQQRSCLFLVERLAELRSGLRDAPLRLVLAYLITVHERQFKYLGGDSTVVKAPGVAYYYDMMLSRLLRLGLPRIALFAVMYERGRLRYDMVVTTGSSDWFWRRLLWEAESNRDLCVTLLMERSKAKAFIETVVRLEREVMEQIDQRNGAK